MSIFGPSKGDLLAQQYGRKMTPLSPELVEKRAAAAKLREEQEEKANKISKARRSILFCATSLTPLSWKPLVIHDYSCAFGKSPDEAILNLKDRIAGGNYPAPVNAILGGQVFPVENWGSWRAGSGGMTVGREAFPSDIQISSSVLYCAGGNPASMGDW